MLGSWGRKNSEGPQRTHAWRFLYIINKSVFPSTRESVLFLRFLFSTRPNFSEFEEFCKLPELFGTIFLGLRDSQAIPNPPQDVPFHRVPSGSPPPASHADFKIEIWQPRKDTERASCYIVMACSVSFVLPKNIFWILGTTEEASLLHSPHFLTDYFFPESFNLRVNTKGIYVTPCNLNAYEQQSWEEFVKNRMCSEGTDAFFFFTYLEPNTISRAKITDLLSHRPRQQIQTKALLAAPKQTHDPKYPSPLWAVIITLLSRKK